MQAPSLWFSDPGRRRDHNIRKGNIEPDYRIRNRQQECCRIHREGSIYSPCMSQTEICLMLALDNI